MSKFGAAKHLHNFHSLVHWVHHVEQFCQQDKKDQGRQGICKWQWLGVPEHQ